MSKYDENETYWLSPIKRCDTCSQPFGTVMYDANVWGCWGNVCQRCFRLAGGKLGTGLGQKYQLQEDDKWLKTEG